MTDLTNRLASAAERVSLALDALLPTLAGPEERLHECMRYAALGGGKRLRPFLVIEAGRLFEADEDRLIRVAAAVECVHTYSLVHDDLPCMDNDDLRRGKPTAHKAYDEATALLAGDALLTLAFEILADPACHPDPQMRCLLITGLARAAGGQGMVAGQMLDILAPTLEMDVPAVTRMNRLKTGALISYAVEAGALLGVAPEDGRVGLHRFATDLGLAFQMVDDLIDAEGDEAEAGKAVGKDAALGKTNFVSLMGVDGAKERVRLLAAQAKDRLAVFGPRAKVLIEAVDFILSRRY
jgi:farnesyl diphosphate synthase